MTCCAPVPEAATRPTAPGRTTLAKPSATPQTTAVPQSGPMTSTSASAAASLSRTSSSTETLSEKTITLSPACDGVDGLGDGVLAGHRDHGEVGAGAGGGRAEGARRRLVVTTGRVAGAAQRGEGLVDRREPRLHAVGVDGAQGHDEVVGAGLGGQSNPMP